MSGLASTDCVTGAFDGRQVFDFEGPRGYRFVNIKTIEQQSMLGLIGLAMTSDFRRMYSMG